MRQSRIIKNDGRQNQAHPNKRGGVYESGREGDTPLAGFSPRKAAIVVYGVAGRVDSETLLAQLGKHTTGKGCLYIKKLADVDHQVLEELIVNSVNAKRTQLPQPT